MWSVAGRASEMANYITSMSQLIGREVAKLPGAVLYGENITNGSRIVGMCRNLQTPPGGRIVNVGNCEPTHVGAGFGMMLAGVNSVLFVKQLDFMLLGVDHFTSTYNAIRSTRTNEPLGSFTIAAVVCDQGYQGPQSSFNGLSDLCSLARVPGYSLTNSRDAEYVLSNELSKPGFRFVTLSQRLFPSEFLDPGLVRVGTGGAWFQYSEGSDATIACMNFSVPEGHQLARLLEVRGLHASLFSVNPAFPVDWAPIQASAARTGRLVVFDDSKGAVRPGSGLLHAVASAAPSVSCTHVHREDKLDLGVSPDSLRVDLDEIADRLAEGRKLPPVLVGAHRARD